MHKMDRRQKATKTPAKFYSSLALVILFSFLFVGSLYFTFHHRTKPNYAHKTLSLPKLPAQHSDKLVPAKQSPWHTLKAQSGDSLGSLFKKVGLNAQTLQAVLQNNKHARLLTHIKTGQSFRFFIKNQTLEKLIVPIDITQYLVVKHQKDRYISQLKLRKMNVHQDYITATVRGSLYTTAKRANISYKLIQQMTDIFNWEIDFVRDIRSGDQFSMVYKAYYIEDKLVNTGEILAVTYNNGGKLHEAIRYASHSGDYDYYNRSGTSLKKAFSRYPIKFSHISSTFNLSRQHPILHYRRPHKGVDLAAPIGTPVHATGNGRVEVIGYHSGYGNIVKIAHSKEYASLYAHLLKFQKGLSRGSVIKRGDVIGYVGQTGLATGPHCHYEFHVNRQPKNPSAIQLPRASPVPAREMASFRHTSTPLLAQLKLIEEARYAAATNNKSKKTS